MDEPVLVDGDRDARVTVVLAHGAGAGMEHPFLAEAASGLAARGLRVVRFEFPYQNAARTGRRGAPDPMPVLQATMRDVVAANAPPPFVLAGKSMGGRVATTVADDLGAAGVVVFGYPFHPPKEPQRLRTAHLAALRTPTLILQGERDPFGTREDVAGYALSPSIEVAWFDDGDHSLAPRKKSGFTAEQHFARAIDSAAAFVRRVTG
ncbi:MAG: alpha/beta fold hydrolase [Planctomycetes bacterium]|nr:alpha/beta fold hydrolase [Planctomycetota bacterium]